MSSAPGIAEPTPWLTIVGIGADGEASLSPPARRALESAELVVGSVRQLALVHGLVRAETRSWPSPMAPGIEDVLARRGRPTCVLATGDPFYFGVGSTLAARLSRGELVCHPAPSCVSLAAARLGWALQDTDVVSLHGRELHTIVRYLQRGRRILALSWDRHTPAALVALLRERGLGASRLTVLERLGASDERIHGGVVQGLQLEPSADLNLIALEVEAEPQAFLVPCRASLPDDAYEHDGQLTKQDIRAVTLSALMPFPGMLLWDVGAGAGSIAIEWSLAHPANRALAIEQDPTRCERIRRNAARLGVPDLRVVHGAAPAALAGLPAPQAIFVGGGGSDAVLECCWAALERGGRLVMNAVSLETEALLLRAHAERGGDLRRLSLEIAAPLGGVTAWRPALPVVQWRTRKP
jgi:precorrin-6B C5,15-methyltransferase / cobalt-precorrin-6B C5,C15-methyltransferase